METHEKLPCNTLTAEELLRSKGIKNDILEECEKSLKTLPKTGKKHFEPDNSWLENVQIEKELKNRRDLLNVERVERVSELASAKWISSQKRALVIKRSGQDWSNFGLEKNGLLYLLAEEALFLLETNCLELTWNGVPCSIQQAYEILIDDSICTLEEYRVYSQLIRYGYRIQRYLYEDFEKSYKSDEFASSKRKIIVEPENGLRMCDNQLQNQQITMTPEKSLMRSDISYISSDVKNLQNIKLEESVEQTVHDVVNHLLCNVEKHKLNTNNPVTSPMIESNRIEIDKDNEEKNQNCKPEIISDETLLCNIKILKDAVCNSNNETAKTSKWPGIRIQRNVKLLPKRNDKVLLPDVSVINSSLTNEIPTCTGKRKISMQDDLLYKKSKHEVIDLSDDEIQELSHSMTRMDILNTLPNVAMNETYIKVKISNRYIPHNIKPQKTVYEYSQTRMLRMQMDDKKARQNCKARNNHRQNASNFNSNVAINRNSPQSRNSHPSFCDSSRPFYHMYGANNSFPCTYRIPFNYGSDFYMQNRITQNVSHNLFVAFGNHGNVVQQSRSLTIQMNNFMMPFMGGYRARHFFTENQQFRPNIYQNFLWQQRFCQRRAMENTMMHNPGHSFARYQYNDANRNDRINNREIINRPSFTIRSKATTWAELKKIWSEEKTITIDDEDQSSNQNKKKCDEIQVIKVANPLISSRNISSLTEIFSKLAIIKSAPERLVRRKKSKYKISYNVYSCNQHYKKANPGQPLYSLVVIRREDSFLQPVDLNRLQQDAKGQIILAYVSMSISYIQPGIITMPNIT